MSTKQAKVSMKLGGRELTLETGLFARQTNASVLVTYGGTVVLATAVMAQDVREGTDFFPLMVEFEEKLYAAGKIKGSRFIKREGRPSDNSVLKGRMIDRAIRPLFDKNLKNDVQIVLSVLSFDQENDPDIVALIGASAALSISDIPWEGPLGGMRVGRVQGKWVMNPTYEQRAVSDVDVVVSGSVGKVIMLEVDGKEVSEEDMYDAIEQGVKEFDGQIKLIQKFVKLCGKEKMQIPSLQQTTEETEGELLKLEEKEHLYKITSDFVHAHIRESVYKRGASKMDREKSLSDLQAKLELYLKEQQIGRDKRKECHGVFMDYVQAYVSKAIIEEDLRVDMRKLDEVRPLEVNVGLLPRTHGTALFMRGETQVLSVVTLGSPSDEQIIEGLDDEEKKWYMHHYNFPPFSVGEARPMRGPGRREIGHGALAEKALEPVLPSRDSFPYTIRVVSEVLGSNGSSSMASTCGSSLSLMDAGVPIKKSVAGIAMGLASDEQGNYKILTDLQDVEDGYGGMDFKIAGTRDGITAIQLDTKTKGITLNVVKETLEQGKKGRLHILDAMDIVIASPREELSEFAPRIVSFRIDPEKIREVIGSGGKVINEIIEQTGVSIDIEDDGLVMVTSSDASASEKAVEWIKNIARVVKAGEVFLGKVSRTLDFGAMVDILPNQSGLVHVSELKNEHVKKVTDVVKVGQMVAVKVINIDEKGRVNLSMKRVNEQERKAVQPES